MTRIDFYIIKDGNSKDEQSVACLLTDKASRQNYKILIVGESDNQLKTLNEMLWTFRDTSFLPHQILAAEADNVNPLLNIALATDSTRFPKANLLINLSGQVPKNAKDFERIAEIVPADKTQRANSRLRYKEYQKLNFELNTHEI